MVKKRWIMYKISIERLLQSSAAECALIKNKIDTKIFMAKVIGLAYGKMKTEQLKNVSVVPAYKLRYIISSKKPAKLTDSGAPRLDRRGGGVVDPPCAHGAPFHSSGACNALCRSGDPRRGRSGEPPTRSGAAKKQRRGAPRGATGAGVEEREHRRKARRGA